jgi:subtilisin family serine protease
VAGAYIKPGAQPAAIAMADAQQRVGALNTMKPLAADAPPATPDLTARQLYLEAAPGGVDARYAWTVPGGRGASVRVIDVEGAWQFAHEDLTQNQGGAVGTPSPDIGWRNHGTAVIGEIGGDGNAFGITGISPDAHVRGVSIFDGLGSAGAIRKAADLLNAGDIILIELHRPGPRATGVGQVGFIAMEWWPDDFAAIRYAVDKGIVVVEAAGNGGENLDDPVYNTPATGFPADWRNPFNRALRDSGAILVGAGAPPPGTHGRDHGPDRSRLDFSNYGQAIDAQGWGREVTTAGYGDLQGGADEQLWYTDTFSGTSSASPIVVGTLACVQGALSARTQPKLTPARARELLRATGTPQQDAAGRPLTQRIGNRPNLRTLIPAALQLREWIGVQFTGDVPANSTRRWFTHSWPAHWHVVWNVVPTTPNPGAPQLDFNVLVERASDAHITYWIDVTNLTASPINIEARYAVLGS